MFVECAKIFLLDDSSDETGGEFVTVLLYSTHDNAFP